MRIAANCLMSGLLMLGGCSFLETVITRTADPDQRTQLGWQAGAVTLRRGELDDYKCIDDLPLQCESVGGNPLCRCPYR